MSAVATYAPRAPRRSRRKAVNDSARRAMQLAALALTDSVPPLLGDDAMAERERYRLEDEARRNRQGVLPLGDALRPSSPGGASDVARAGRGLLNLDASRVVRVPGCGSSLGTSDAGNQTRDSRVDSDGGSY